MDVTHCGQSITADSLVQEVIERHPQTIPVFIRHRLACVGCTISPFHTVADSAREYALSLECLLDELNRSTSRGVPAGLSNQAIDRGPDSWHN